MIRYGSMLAVAALAAACSTSSSSDSSDAGVGGPVKGALDTHCAEPDGGKTAQAIDFATCHLSGDTDAGNADAGHDHADDGGSATSDEGYGEAMFNDEGDDDDCKYHLKWSASTVRQNQDVTFTVTVTELATGKPATQAAPHLEVFLNDTHPAPNTTQKATPTTDGTFTVGPVRFDASGQWTVRFHISEDCSDLDEASPHGHGAFFVNVP